jgi:acyl-CoA hydrolase
MVMKDLMVAGLMARRWVREMMVLVLTSGCARVSSVPVMSLICPQIQSVYPFLTSMMCANEGQAEQCLQHIYLHGTYSYMMYTITQGI